MTNSRENIILFAIIQQIPNDLSNLERIFYQAVVVPRIFIRLVQLEQNIARSITTTWSTLDEAERQIDFPILVRRARCVGPHGITQFVHSKLVFLTN